MTQPNIDQLFKQIVEHDQEARVEFLAVLSPAIRSDLEALLNSDIAAEAQGYMEPNDTMKHRTDQVPELTAAMLDQVETLPDQVADS